MMNIVNNMRQKFGEVLGILSGLFNMTWKALFGLALLPILGIVFLGVYVYELAKNEADRNS